MIICNYTYSKCKFCNKQIRLAEWQRKDGRGVFCSKTCYTKYRIPIHERFWEKVEKTPTCWNWIGHLNNRGYGTFANTKYNGAHRFSWYLHFGEIPNGLMVLHKCIGNAKCINPAHLYLGTHQDNMNDKVAQDRQSKGMNHYSFVAPEKCIRGSKIGTSKLSEKDVQEIKSMINSETVIKIAKLYSVSINTIYRIIKKETWRHVA